MLAKNQGAGLPDHLRITIANHQSVSLRFKGDYDQFRVVIKDIFDRIAIDLANIRSHCVYGHLLLSRT